MKRWFWLAGAIASEVTATLSLKAALDESGWYAVVGGGYLLAFVCLANALRSGMALGVGYGIWGALGVAITAITAALLFGETLTPLMGLGIALVIGGVMVVEVGSGCAAGAAEGKR